MKPTPLRYLAFAWIVCGLVFIGLEVHKTIIVQVDGQKQPHQTFALTVGTLLQSLDLSLRPADRVSPPPGHLLKDGDIVQIERAHQVRILADGKALTLETHEQRPSNLLSLIQVPLFPGDEVLVNGRPVDPGASLSTTASLSLQVRRATSVSLYEGAKVQQFYSTEATLGKALNKVGIILHATDRLDPPPETLLSGTAAPLEAHLQRSRPITVQGQGSQLSFRSAAATVGEALAEAGLALQGLDYSIPAAEAPPPEDGQIRLVRVQETVTVEQEPLAFETELQPAPEVELDSRQVVQDGEYGLTARRIRVRYEDGQEVTRRVEDEWIAKEPQKRIVGYGTKIVIRTLNTPDGPIEYWRAIQMYATSYSPCRIYKDRCDSYTALGATLKKGVVAMTNEWCRYTCGDRVYVPGYGVGAVLDTGGGIPGRYWIDLGYSEEDYVSWHQTVTVYFLAPVPSNLMWVLP